MLPAAEARLPATGRVLDVGGGTRPVARADVVLDILPGATVVRDICDHDPWPFADGEFDFAVCSHTLEDVRDPIWVCSEMVRIAKAGYIEVPSRLEEQSFGFLGRWAGWSHHRWLIDVGDGRIDFAFKPHVVHARWDAQFPPGFQAALTLEQRVQALWWEGSFDYSERLFASPRELDDYLADFVREHRNDAVLPRLGAPRRVLGGLRRGALKQ